jgi:hypothetical protein
VRGSVVTEVIQGSEHLLINRRNLPRQTGHCCEELFVTAPPAPTSAVSPNCLLSGAFWRSRAPERSAGTRGRVFSGLQATSRCSQAALFTSFTQVRPR